MLFHRPLVFILIILCDLTLKAEKVFWKGVANGPCESGYEYLGFIRQYFLTSCSKKTFHQEIGLLGAGGFM